MKKVVLVLISILLLTGCMSNKGDNLKAFKDYNGKFTSYELNGTMSIISNEDEFTYDINVGVDNKTNYKVSLLNTINNHEQVILKNSDAVYVVTPNLNKSFKFMSEWPNNSSQAYLIESLVKDVNSDPEAKITETNDGYTITAKVNYPNNVKMHHEVITTDKEYNIKKVEVKNEQDVSMLTVNIKNVKKNPNFNKDYFKMDNLETDKKDENFDKNSEECLKACKENDKDCADACKSKETSNILEDIIYPLYIPTDTYLSTKDTVNTDNGNRIILTFAGNDPFILVEEVSKQNNEMEVIPVSGEPLLLGNGYAALSNNSLYWCSGGVDFYLTSNTLDNAEMMTIAESITNSSSLVASTK